MLERSLVVLLGGGALAGNLRPMREDAARILARTEALLVLSAELVRRSRELLAQKPRTATW
jgi:hypothetical protein